MKRGQPKQPLISFSNDGGATGLNLPRRATIGAFLVLSLLAFEIFNFDTTRFALSSLLGDIHFLSISWASILAVAFCSIDFAGLIRLFTPQRGADEPRAVWYLTGAWLLGATLNAMMTWWAVSLTLINNSFLGNEVLGREQLLLYVPIFVAALVWLTRILFIGSLSVAGDYIFDLQQIQQGASARQRIAQPRRASSQPRPNTQPAAPRPVRAKRPAPRPAPQPAMPQPKSLPQPVAAASTQFAEPPQREILDESDLYDDVIQIEPAPVVPEPIKQPASRIRRRPPMMGQRPMAVHAKGREE